MGCTHYLSEPGHLTYGKLLWFVGLAALSSFFSLISLLLRYNAQEEAHRAETILDNCEQTQCNQQAYAQKYMFLLLIMVYTLPCIQVQMIKIT